MSDRLLVEPAERRPAVLEVIDSARKRLILSPVECDDRRVLEAIRAACSRGVRVEAILTRRTKGRSSPRLFRLLLEALGVHVWRYGGPHGKYHAKYAVADDRVALIGSLNFTRRCFRKTCDFLLVTDDRDVVSSLTAVFQADCRGESAELPSRLSPRLIVGPELARNRLAELLGRAQRRICLIDPKVSDPAMLAVLRLKAASVGVLRQHSNSGLIPHGKLLVVDDDVAFVGSMALSANNLDRRREIGVMVNDRRIVRQLLQLFPESARRQQRDVRLLRPVVSAA